ncbi:MAG: VOC family protein [Actinomycetota bacterium]|nr:VOC family protein [Actinomycetota bacterium]
MLLGDAELVAFVASRDLEASARFYGGVLGFGLLDASEFANAYDANGRPLRVTLVDRFAPAAHTVLGWRVRDIVATTRALREAGVAFKRYEGMAQDQHDVWVAPGGSRVAWFADPDGNVLSLQQPPSVELQQPPSVAVHQSPSVG